MEQHLAPIKPSPHKRHAPLTALVAAAAVGLSASLSASVIPSFSFILSAHLRLRASLLPPRVLHPAPLLPPISFRQQSAFALCVVLHHDALQPLHLGSLPRAVSGFRMDVGSAEQQHQVSSQ